MAEKGKISPLVALAVGLGAIIGAGIFVLSGTAIALAGADALLAFFVVGLVAVLVALQTGELGSILPHAKGTSYSFVYNAFGSELGFVTGIIVYSTYVTMVTAIALGFGSYLASVLSISSAGFPVFFAILLIIVLSIVNILGIKSAANTDFVLVIIKVLVLLIFIAFSFLYITHGQFPSANFSISGSQAGLFPFFQACVVIFFAYSGFQVINTFTDRIRGGANAAAKAILGSVIVSIVLYVLVVFSLMLLAPASTFTISADPLSSALKAAGASASLFYIVDIGALIATASATLAGLLTASRILYQISKDHLIPSAFSVYDRKKDVAVYCVLVSMVIGIASLFLGNIYVIVAVSDFGLIFSYIMLSLALIHFKRLKRSGTFNVPLYPYLPIATILILMAFLYGMPRESLLVGTVLVFTALLVYYSLREIREKRVVKVRLFD